MHLLISFIKKRFEKTFYGNLRSTRPLNFFLCANQYITNCCITRDPSQLVNLLKSHPSNCRFMSNDLFQAYNVNPPPTSHLHWPCIVITQLTSYHLYIGQCGSDMELVGVVNGLD